MFIVLNISAIRKRHKIVVLTILEVLDFDLLRCNLSKDKNRNHYCNIKRDHVQNFPWNQLVSKFFCKDCWFAGENVDISVKLYSVEKREILSHFLTKIWLISRKRVLVREGIFLVFPHCEFVIVLLLLFSTAHSIEITFY